jgi:hypothetical protein
MVFILKQNHFHQYKIWSDGAVSDIGLPLGVKKKYSPEFFLDKMKVLSAHYYRCNRDVIFASTRF